MTKTLLTIGLNDKNTERQEIEKELNQESIMMEKETKEIFFK